MQVTMPQKKILASEARKLSSLIKGRVVSSVKRFNNSELMLEFNDKTRLYVNARGGNLEFSVT